MANFSKKKDFISMENWRVQGYLSIKILKKYLSETFKMEDISTPKKVKHIAGYM